jgi:hypothetical protein
LEGSSHSSHLETYDDRGWDKYAHRAYEELSADENQQQEEEAPGDPIDFSDSRDDFLWSDREDFERIERSSLSDEELEEEGEELTEVDLMEHTLNSDSVTGRTNDSAMELSPASSAESLSN